MTSLSHPKYRPDIDGLRAVAVLAVVVFHAFPSRLKGGFIGVDIFFVISGYLISTIIYENLERGTFSFFEFYARRIKRIIPALALVLVFCMVIGWFLLLGDEYNQLGKHIAGGAAFISNLLLWNESGYFDKVADTKPLLHLWSLGVEEQFYIFWPLILWCAYKKKINLLSVGVVIALGSFYLNISEIKTNPVGDFYSPQTRIWELMFGSILAWLMLYKPTLTNPISGKINITLAKFLFSDPNKKNQETLASIISIFAFLLLLYGFWRIDQGVGFPGKWALIPVLGALFLIYSGPDAWVNRVILSNRAAVWFGLISFPLYLWHWPLLSFARIVEGGTPSLYIRVSAVIISVGLAWLTVILIENPIRQEKTTSRFKIMLLYGLTFAVGSSGFIIYKSDFSISHGYEKLIYKRRGFEHAYGSSLSWIRGKSDWLFLGNEYDSTIAKLKLSILPSNAEVEKTKEIFTEIAKTSAIYNTKVILIIAPDKSSIYPEYLPEGLTPSKKKYVDYFLDELNGIPNLTIYNPTEDLVRLKSSEDTLYYATDTHWNNKGAYLAYSGLSRLIGLPVPNVNFQKGSKHRGDLLDISKLENFPLSSNDSWEPVWINKPSWREEKIPNEPDDPSFGPSVIVFNQNALSNKYIWVVGDSFSGTLRQYLNATFREIRYLGHWANKLNGLPAYLKNSERKPDMIIIEKVERSF